MSTPFRPGAPPPAITLLPGDPAPTFLRASDGDPTLTFDAAAGRYLLLCFYGSAGDDAGRGAIDAILARRELFDDKHVSCFAISHDSRDRTEAKVKDALPGFRVLWDFDGAIGKMYGSLPLSSGPQANTMMRRMWVLLAPGLHVMEVSPFARAGSERKTVFDLVKKLPAVGRTPGFDMPVPVIVLPDVFEPQFCRRLIDLYEKNGGEESGFTRDVGGKRQLVHLPQQKRRRDYVVDDDATIQQAMARVQRRIVPEVKKVFQFNISNMERCIVSCYDSSARGHHSAHRDNMSKSTAHRRFAATINLNAEFEGGELTFPEYGSRTFKPPPGCAIVFSCSLLHAVTEVTKGKRYAFLPFLYDKDAAKDFRDTASFIVGQEEVMFS